MTAFAIILTMGLLLAVCMAPIVWVHHVVNKAGVACQRCDKDRETHRYPLLYDAWLCVDCLEFCIGHNTDLLTIEIEHAR